MGEYSYHIQHNYIGDYRGLSQLWDVFIFDQHSNDQAWLSNFHGVEFPLPDDVWAKTRKATTSAFNFRSTDQRQMFQNIRRLACKSCAWPGKTGEILRSQQICRCASKLILGKRQSCGQIRRAYIHTHVYYRTLKKHKRTAYMYVYIYIIIYIYYIYVYFHTSKYK